MNSDGLHHVEVEAYNLRRNGTSLQETANPQDVQSIERG